MASDTIKQVDIFINAHTYTINCPAQEEPALKRAADDMNDFIQSIRRHNPQLPHEELLVLYALTLHEKAEQLTQLQQQHEQASQLIEQMLGELNRVN